MKLLTLLGFSLLMAGCAVQKRRVTLTEENPARTEILRKMDHQAKVIKEREQREAHARVQREIKYNQEKPYYCDPWSNRSKRLVRKNVFYLPYHGSFQPM